MLMSSALSIIFSSGFSNKLSCFAFIIVNGVLSSWEASCTNFVCFFQASIIGFNEILDKIELAINIAIKLIVNDIVKFFINFSDIDFSESTFINACLYSPVFVL